MLTAAVARAALALCLALLLSSAATAGDDRIPPAVEAATSAPGTDNLATALLQVEVSRKLLRQIRADIRSAEQTSSQSADYSALHAALNRARQHPSETHQAESSLTQLMEMESMLDDHSEILQQMIEESARSIGLLESDIDRLAAELLRWETLRAIANERTAPAPLIEQAQRLIEDLAKQSSAVYPVRDRLLGQLTRQIGLQQELDEATDQLLAQRESLAKLLRESERDPLWQVVPLQPGTVEAAHKALGLWVSGMVVYIQNQWATLAAIAILLMALTRWLLSWGGLFLRQHPLDPRLSQDVLRVIERPLWVMGFVGLLGLNFAPKGPIAYYDLLWLLILLPSVLLTQPINGPRHGLSVTALAILMAVFPFRTILEAFPAIDRWVLALQAIVMVVALLLDGGWKSSATSGNSVRPWLRWLVTGVIGGLSLSLMLNLLGWAGYARVLVDGILGTLGFAMVYTVARSVAFSLMLGCLQSPMGQCFHAVRARPQELAYRLHRSLFWLMAGLIVFGGLYAFRIQEEARVFIVDLSQASLPVGSAELPVKSVINALLWVVGTAVLIRLTRWLLEEEILPRLRLPSGVPFAITMVVRYLLAIAGLVLALLTLGIDVSKVTLLAGALSVGMGFGLQNIVNNFFSGLILLFERPIHQGDVVEVGKLRGTVTKIGIRSSLIKTSEGAEVIVPNANLISKEVVNWTLSDRRRRIEIPVRVNRNVDEEDLLALLLTVARASNEVLADPVPEAMLRETNADSMDFVLACWIQRYEDQRRIASRLRIAINHQLAERGIAGPPPVTEVEVIRHGPGE
jgi:small-conductance mechanosensitive channel